MFDYTRGTYLTKCGSTLITFAIEAVKTLASLINTLPASWYDISTKLCRVMRWITQTLSTLVCIVTSSPGGAADQMQHR